MPTKLSGKNILVLLTTLISLDCFAIGIANKTPFQQKPGQTKNEKPHQFEEIGVEEHLGETIDLDLTFTNEDGKEVALREYVKDKPVLMAMVYYECPTLCNLHLNAMLDTFNQFKWGIGDKFNFITDSIDPDEPAKLAKSKKKSYLEKYNKGNTSDAQKGWHFLTGKQKNITTLAKQLGFKYKKNLMDDQYMHTAVAYIITPEGKISYYHYGIQIKPEILRLSLVEASDNKIGNITDRLILYCLQYDPDKKTYGFYAFNIVRGLGFLIVFGMLIYFGRFFWKEHNTKI